MRPGRFELPDGRVKAVYDRMGGVTSLLYTAVPIVVFVVVNALTALLLAVCAAVGAVLIVAAVRILRGEPLQPVVFSVVAVGIAALLAYLTGSAKGYFTVNILTSGSLAVLGFGSILLGWPLIGVLWTLLNGRGTGWRANRFARRQYAYATGLLALVFGAQFVVWGYLYLTDRVGWLAAARLGMSLPLLLPAAVLVVLLVRRAERGAV